MADKPAPIPDHYRRVTPALIINGAEEALKWYADIFGAQERMRFPGPENTIAHAEMEIGDAVIIVEDASEYMGTKAPPADGLEGTPVFQFIYVEDVDATVEKAVQAGAKLKRAPETQFYGDRDGYIIDPFGHGWTIASHVEDVSGDELMERMNKMFSGG